MLLKNNCFKVRKDIEDNLQLETDEVERGMIFILDKRCGHKRRDMSDYYEDVGNDL